MNARARFLAGSAGLLVILAGLAAAQPPCLEYGDHLRYVAGLPMPNPTYDYMGYEALAVKGTLAYAYQYSRGLRVIDLAEPADPINLGILQLNAYIVGLACIDHFVLAVGGPLKVVDVQDDLQPVLVATINTPGDARGVAVYQRLAYVADGGSGLSVYDVNQSASPVFVRTVPTSGSARSVALLGNLLLVGCTGWLDVYSLADAATPVRLGSIAVSGTVTEISADDNLVLIEHDWDASLVDISDPAAPVLADALSSTDAVTSVALRDGVAWLGLDRSSSLGGSLERHDVGDPSSPVLLGRDLMVGYPQALVFALGYLYTANGGDWNDAETEGLHVFDPAHATSPPRTGFLGPEYVYSYGGGGLHNDWLYLVGEVGLGAIDLTDPAQPTTAEVVNFPDGFGLGGVIAGEHLIARRRSFLSTSYWLESYDLSDPAAPVRQDTLTLDGNGARPCPRGDLLYLANVPDGIRVLRVEANGHFSPLGVFWTGTEAAVRLCHGDRGLISVGGEGWRLVEFADPVTPVVLGTLAETDLFRWRTPLAWDGDLIYVRRPLPADAWPWVDEWEIIDVTDPAAPAVRCAVRMPFLEGVKSIVVRDDIAYVASLRMTYVYDVSDPGAPVLVGDIPNYMVQSMTLYEHDDVLVAVGYVADVSTWPYQCVSPTSVGPDLAAARETSLLAAPNPFNPRTELRFRLAASGPVELTVFDLRGRVVRRLVEVDLPAGEHAARWDGRDDGGATAAAGIYLARLRAGGSASTLRLALVR